jgi:hypothetical protein
MYVEMWSGVQWGRSTSNVLYAYRGGIHQKEVVYRFFKKVIRSIPVTIIVYQQNGNW